MAIQSTIFSKISKAAIAVPIIAVGVAFNAASAQAAALTGNFQIGNFLGELALDSDGVYFSSDHVDYSGYDPYTSEVSINGAEDFAQFKSAFIQDISIPFSGPQESFFDFSVEDPAPLGANTPDGLSTFDLTKVSDLMVEQEDEGSLALTLEFAGNFISDTQDTSYGKGNLTFQFAEQGVTVEDFESRLAGGEKFENITFSGAAFAAKDVPEPATMLGLMAVGGVATTAIRKRKEAVDA
ncbi:PEP-CTERM sorting domain-containing protein [Spirulina sp. CS-785/01]|uniref:PEP-CTERM sorting domain-containing protein n=1 Tax=Spirulina sp. CS-785/01 TaxID=3021716 RepID=UPI00232BB19C|nr:PEP-CTERM sorting domain-containing protein [Spirulina sp. CS-785/01]MDB9313987.1 PEP-CTERM sorting domain-containing protein [Spirulina sp. CS-785/01]